MTTPHHQHALAAAWSLHAARARLTEMCTLEAAQNAVDGLEAADGLRSTTYGQRHASGGHSDPVGGLLTAHRTQPDSEWSELADRLTTKLTWLADTLRTTPGPDPWWRLHDALPRLQPGTAATLTKHLTDEDTWVRAAVRLGPARHPIVGVPCPACDDRELYVQDAGPVDYWTVICAAGCRCAGQGCGCGMDSPVEGVEHIWPRVAVISAWAAQR